MANESFGSFDFGDPVAENDSNALRESFLETSKWHTIVENTRTPFVVGRKGSGKSAIAIKLELESATRGGHFIPLVPREFRHVELRQLLQELVHSNTSWQYIYSLVWEGIILGQIVRYLLAEENHGIYYSLPKDLKSELGEFQEKCGFYVDALDDALSDLLSGTLRENTSSTSAMQLSDLRKVVQPYKWKELIRHLEDEFKPSVENRILICIDGLDDQWDVTDASLHFLAQLLETVRNLSGKLSSAVRFVVCLRDNIFRSLVDTKCVEYDKLEAALCYLDWDSLSLFTLIARRALPWLPAEDAAPYFRSYLPKTIQGMPIEDYLGYRLLKRPRDYINFFLFLQTSCSDISLATEAHIADALSSYQSNRLVDLDNEFGLTYPGIADVVSRLHPFSGVLQKDDLLAKLTLLIDDESINKRAPELLYHYGTPTSLAYLLLSIGVIGVHDPENRTVQFVHEYSINRVQTLFAAAESFHVHPVYTALSSSNPISHVEPSLADSPSMIVNPSDYAPVEDCVQEIQTVGEQTSDKRNQLIASRETINRGREHFRRFEVWVRDTLSICFVSHLTMAREQSRILSGGKRFEIIFEIVSNERPWDEIKTKYETHRLLVECKNTPDPTEDDFLKLERDMKSLGNKVAFMVYHSDKNEPSKQTLDWQRRLYQNSDKSIIIIALTDTFLMRCLEANPRKCLRNLASLWRNHMELYLPV